MTEKMIEIVIVGASAAGFSACRALAESGRALKLSLVSGEKYLPYRRDLLLDLIKSEVKHRDLFLCSETYFSQKGINFLPERSVTGIDFEKRRVFIRGNQRLAYDYLIIASGRRPQTVVCRKNREGSVILYGLGDAEAVMERFMIPGTVIVSGNNGQAFSLARLFADKGREVKLFCPGGTEEAESFAGKGIEVITDYEPQELISEGRELKAVRLNNGKIIAMASVFFCGPFKPATDFIDPQFVPLRDGYITVGDDGRAAERVYACGSCTLGGMNAGWQSSAEQGIKCAAAVLKEIECACGVSSQAV